MSTITKNIILEFFGHELDRKNISDNDNLLRSRVLDSIEMLRFILYLEEKFNVNIGEEELIPENFETIEAIVTLLQKKGATGRG